MYLANLTIIILLMLLMKWIWNRRFLYWLSLNMKGPMGLPIIGSGFSYLMEPQGNLKFYEKLFQRYGTIFRLWIGSNLYICIGRREDIETVLTSSACINRARIPSKIVRDAIGGEGLFTLENKRWKKSRRTIAPSFSYNVIVGYIPLFNKNSMECVRQLKNYIGNEPFDIRPFVEMVTTVSFFESTLTLEITPEMLQKYGEVLSELQNLVGIRILGPWYQSDLIWNFSKYGRKAKKMKRIADEIKDSVMSAHVTDGYSNVTLLDKLVRMSKEGGIYTLQDIKAELTTIVIAATDTSTWSISITLLLLAMHQDVQDKVIEELRVIFPDKNSDVKKEDLAKMSYLEMCIQEQLRLFPSIPITVRRIDRQFQLNQYNLPIGADILINLYQVHRNPEYWGANANKFDPENFSAENISKIKPFTYLPFSDGLRNCIGKSYAMIGIKATLANILRNYKITTKLKLEELSVQSTINIMIKNSCMVQLEPRHF